MSKEILETKIKAIFNQDKIRIMDVIIANRLIEEWKKATNYKNHNSIIDNEPNYDTSRINTL